MRVRTAGIRQQETAPGGRAARGGFRGVRPAGRTYLEVEVLYSPGKGKS
jgi:hypothetical protein